MPWLALSLKLTALNLLLRSSRHFKDSQEDFEEEKRLESMILKCTRLLLPNGKTMVKHNCPLSLSLTLFNIAFYYIDTIHPSKSHVKEMQFAMQWSFFNFTPILPTPEELNKDALKTTWLLCFTGQLQAGCFCYG